MTETLPVHCEPVVASAAIGSLFFPVPVTRIAAWRIRACAARARSGNPPRLVLGNASVSVLRTVDGRSPRSSERDRGPARDRDDNDGDGAPTSVTAIAVRPLTSARCSARPVRTLAVSAVADGDERRDALPDVGDAVPVRPGVTTPDTRGDDGDRSTALTMIACPIGSRRTPSRAPRARPAHCRRRPFPPRSSGWALTPFYSPLKSPLYALRRFGSHT